MTPQDPAVGLRRSFIWAFLADRQAYSLRHEELRGKIFFSERRAKTAACRELLRERLSGSEKPS